MQSRVRGFTLIEIAIVLVIIGLIVGGVLVGQDLVRAAAVRATVSQIEKYNSAVNTFIGKYNALPGDMNAATATQFGFTARGTYAGQGDGNGVIYGYGTAGADGTFQSGGESALFWVDLTSANGNNLNLIDGSFSAATINAVALTASQMSGYFPLAKLGMGNYIYVGAFNDDGVNYFGISVPTSTLTQGYFTSTPGLSVMQAYSIDSKVDDGLPLTGNVLAKYLSTVASWGTTAHASPAVAGDCYDATTAAGEYAISVGNGTSAVCALSIRMQAGIGN